MEDCTFQVSAFYDLDGNTMKAKFEAFVETLGPRDTVVVYFSGHGVEFQGEHFFIPAEMEEPDKPSKIRERAFSSDEATDLLQKRVNDGLKILISDACREQYEVYREGLEEKYGHNFEEWNIHYDPKIHQRVETKGFSRPKYMNTIKMCATSKGQMAAAGHGTSMSAYTEALSQNLNYQGENIYRLNERLTSALRDKAQSPEMSIINVDNASTFCFLPN